MSNITRAEEVENWEVFKLETYKYLDARNLEEKREALEAISFQVAKAMIQHKFIEEDLDPEAEAYKDSLREKLRKESETISRAVEQNNEGRTPRNFRG